MGGVGSPSSFPSVELDCFTGQTSSRGPVKRHTSVDQICLARTLDEKHDLLSVP